MSDVMLHGVLNMPLPDDPAECDLLTWVQFKDRARQASARIEELEAKLAKAVAELREIGEAAKACGYGYSHIICQNCSNTHHAVDAILAELKGQDDD